LAFGDVIAFGMTLFVCAIIIVVGYAMFSATASINVDSTIGPIGINNTYTSPDGVTTIRPAETGELIFQALDWIMVFITVALIAGMFISGYMLPSHPVFAFISFFAILIWLWIAPFFSNIFLEVMQLPVMSTAANAFPLTSTVIMNLPLVGLIAGVLMGVATYGKAPGGAPF